MTCRSGQSSCPITSRSVTPNLRWRPVSRAAFRLGSSSSTPRSPVSVGQGEKRGGEEGGDGECGEYGEPGTGLEPALGYRVKCRECGYSSDNACRSSGYAPFHLVHADHLRKCGIEIGRFHPLPLSFPRNRQGTVKHALNLRQFSVYTGSDDADSNRLTGDAYRPAPRAVEATRGAGRFRSTRYLWEVFD